MGTNEVREERKEMQKICPLYALGEVINSAIEHKDYDYENSLCDGPRCAWYSEAKKGCAIQNRKGVVNHETDED